jgi:hypothetical protein
MSINLRRLGYFGGPKPGGEAVQRIDISYIYALGSAVHPLKGIGHKNLNAWQIRGPLVMAKDALGAFLYQSVFSGGLRVVVHPPANKLMGEIDALLAAIRLKNHDEQITLGDCISMMDAFDGFEPVLLAELQSASSFLVSAKGGFDNAVLIDFGGQLFPASLPTKVADAMADIEAGCRCLAFELWTAMAFHFHRANEAVLREYFDLVAGKHRRPKIRTMSSMIRKMKDLKVGDPNIIAALDNLVVFHRNPVAHPGQTLNSLDEALSLYAAIRAALGYMLDKLEVVNPAALESAPAAAPLIEPPA